VDQLSQAGVGDQTMQDKARRRGRKSQQTKDRVLQARIPEQLDDELRDRAEKLGLSVSTIVRNVLMHTFDLVEGVVIDSSQIARVLTGRDSGASDTDMETVIGWQEVILNRNGVCEECNVILPLGQRAAIGVPTGPRATLLCMECLAALPSSIDDPATQPKQNPKKKRPSRSKSNGRKKAAD
jgi:predicted DNA-binding protein